jgi:serine/threonine protein kinase/tetratricopeptide (TPR) repeat protein
MNRSRLSDSLAMTAASAPCPRCHTTALLSRGLCLGCLIGSALDEAEQLTPDDFAALLAAVPVPDNLRRLGHYELLEEIGRGGMGVIYRARQRHSRRIVALKRVLSYHAESRETLARFRREAEAASSLDHPNILPIYEVGETEEGIPYFSMKYAAGGSLAEIGPALRGDPRQIVRLLAKVTRAVERAHGQGILHRDLKPGNILLDARGEPLVSDFGLAKWLDTSTDLTRTLTIFGTPGYIAPEQARSSRAQLTPAADIYSLGAILFNLCTGRPPFLGEHALAVIQQASEKEAPKLRSLAPALDRDLETICGKCLEREPEARYQSAGPLADDLERWLEGRPIMARPLLPPARAWRWLKRNPKLAATTIAALVFATTAVLLFLSQRSPPGRMLPSKSIAVLPFENLGNKENTYLAQGIQDDVLTKLANIADLKVIGRASVMQYEGSMTRDDRTIGRELGVAHLLAGSVQRTGDKVRVAARLIATSNDTELWAQTYERPLAEVFAIESEMTRTIAAQLQTRLSPGEMAAVEHPPTRDLTAFGFYAEAKERLLKVGFNSDIKPALIQAVDLLNRAVARDQEFLLAYCQLASAHDYLYFLGHDRTPARLALAETALQRALRIKPGAGEAHLARARHLYYGYLKYDESRAEIALAQRTLPNDPLVFELSAFIDRRQNNWKDAERNLKRALELDPRNLFILQQLSLLYEKGRRFSEIAALMDRALSIAPGDIDTRMNRAFIELSWHADSQPLYATIQSILEERPEAAKEIADSWFTLALSERDPVAAERALAALGEDSIAPDAILLSRTFGEGIVARMVKDEAKARAAFTRAREEQENLVRQQPDYGPAVCVLGLIDAALGRKEDALREGRRAMELLPVAKDSINGGHVIEFFAITCAWVGEKDLAIEQLARVSRISGHITYGYLKLHPFWDPLRGDPRFEKIVASLAPKS